MDRLIYTAMTGASQALAQQDVVTNNLANTSTTGFRAQLASFRSAPLSFSNDGTSNDNTTRTFVLSATTGADYTHGPISQTGNPLDVAVEGPGWLAVQTPDGNEAYTRAGSLHVDASGQLMNANDLPVIGNSGPVAVPPGSDVTIGEDGTVTALTPGDPPQSIASVDQLKLVNPDPATLTRGNDGLFHAAEGEPADADPAVKLAPKSLEGSNVNAVAAMVSMIANARQYQMQAKLLQNADQNDQSANQLLTFS
jgi:flagellar basal-body rod protein FlgF